MTDKLNSGHFHESLDRACMLANVWDQYVLHGPAAQATPELAEAAMKACYAMHECYQAIGRHFHDSEEAEAGEQ